jgi:hypothetical protein
MRRDKAGCPRYARKQTFVGATATSALGQCETLAVTGLIRFCETQF